MATSREGTAPDARFYAADLALGDRLADERDERQVTGRPFTTAAGTTLHVRIRKLSEPSQTDPRTWGAHERASASVRHEAGK